MKRFRLNVVVVYHNMEDVSRYRRLIHESLKCIACLHRLDYATSENLQVTSGNGSAPKAFEGSKHDLFYYRSTDATQIEAKHLRMLIACMFGKSFLSELGIDVFYQTQKALSEYPFPKDYYPPVEC